MAKDKVIFWWDMEVSLSRPFSWTKFLNGSMMVFGTTVGAGMLGIPLLTAGAGFGSALSVTLLVWLFMAITGLLLLEVTFHMPKGANFITLSMGLLGKKGKWMTIILFLFLYYAFLVAYFSGGAPLLGFCLGLKGTFLPLTLFTCLFGGLVLLGSKAIHRTNFILSLVMLIIFPALICLGSSSVSMERLFSEPLVLSSAAIPVLFGAFGFHNVIPSLSDSLGEDKRALRGAIIFGTFLAFLLYSIWQWMVLGSLSLESLKEILGKGLPVTYALAEGSKKQVFVVGQVFAFLALTTSFLGVSLSLVDFIRDGLEQKMRKISRSFCVFLALFPPLLCVLFNPHLFDRALGVAGGFGETLLNGILPVLLFVKIASLKKIELKKGHKAFLGILLLFSFWVISIEVSHLLK